MGVRRGDRRDDGRCVRQRELRHDLRRDLDDKRPLRQRPELQLGEHAARRGLGELEPGIGDDVVDLDPSDGLVERMADHRAAPERGLLPYGEQRRLEIVRALATHPKLLLLDEPAAGMNPNETARLMEMIRAIRRDFGLTILLIEHHMEFVMGICERIYVLDYGEVIASGPPAAIQNDSKVIKAYLGEPA